MRASQRPLVGDTGQSKETTWDGFCQVERTPLESEGWYTGIQGIEPMSVFCVSYTVKSKLWDAVVFWRECGWVGRAF